MARGLGIRLGAVTIRDRWRMVQLFVALVGFVVLEATVALLFAFAHPELAPLLVAVAVILLLPAAGLLVMGARSAADPVPIVEAGGSRVRLGRSMIDVADLDEATQVTFAQDGEVTIVIRLGMRNGAHGLVVLSTADRFPLDDGQLAALLGVIEHSSIRVPVDRYDPAGKFAETNFPDHLDRESATELVLRRSRPAPAG